MSYQYPCFVINPIYIWRGCNQQIFYISFAITHFWILWKKIQNKLSGSLEKVEKTAKQVENQQIFIVTLTKKFSMPDYWYKLYKFTQYTWALNSSLFWRIQLNSNVFLDPFDKEAFFTANWLYTQLLVIYPDRGDQANHFW